MNNEFVSVPREQLGELIDGDSRQQGSARNKLRALLAQPAAQHQGRPTGLSQGWNLTRQSDGFVIGHSSQEPKAHHKAQALKDGRVYVPFMVEQHQGEPVAPYRFIVRSTGGGPTSCKVDEAAESLWKSEDHARRYHAKGKELTGDQVAGRSVFWPDEFQIVPIYTHANTGEVERLRRHKHAADVALAAATRLYKKHEATISELRAELAERDALLREALEFVDAFKSGLGADRESCDKHGVVVWDRIQSLEYSAHACLTQTGCACPGDGVGECKRCPYTIAEPSAPVERLRESLRLEQEATGKWQDTAIALGAQLAEQTKLLSRAASEIEALATSLGNSCESFEGDAEDDPQAIEEVKEARELAERIRTSITSSAKQESEHE